MYLPHGHEPTRAHDPFLRYLQQAICRVFAEIHAIFVEAVHGLVA